MAVPTFLAIYWYSMSQGALWHNMVRHYSLTLHSLTLHSLTLQSGTTQWHYWIWQCTVWHDTVWHYSLALHSLTPLSGTTQSDTAVLLVGGSCRARYLPCCTGGPPIAMLCPYCRAATLWVQVCWCLVLLPVQGTPQMTETFLDSKKEVELSGWKGRVRTLSISCLCNSWAHCRTSYSRWEPLTVAARLPQVPASSSRDDTFPVKLQKYMSFLLLRRFPVSWESEEQIRELTVIWLQLRFHMSPNLQTVSAWKCMSQV